MADIKLPKPPLFYRLLSSTLYKVGIVTIWTKGTPDCKWSLTFYKVKDSHAE
jgi:hypothetical protein